MFMVLVKQPFQWRLFGGNTFEASMQKQIIVENTWEVYFFISLLLVHSYLYKSYYHQADNSLWNNEPMLMIGKHVLGRQNLPLNWECTCKTEFLLKYFFQMFASKSFLKVAVENTHLWGKCHCIAGLQFNRFGFNCFTRSMLATTYFLFWSNPILLNWRPAVGTVILPLIVSVLWL